ncbi:hypothetical protein [Microbispora rosea]|uniref:hypothetical protein n=1 Tax=Microbispora rosea TaxID=58117 RepID=UPI0004C3735C|nr:hypothetical protein [Microbispora rosea]
MTAPAKPWRVAVPQLGSSDYPTQEAALHVARQWQELGHWVSVRRWVDGRWVLFERLQPPQAGEAS